MADFAKKTLDDYWVPWSDISPAAVAKFREELEAASGEAEMQTFLEAHPSFLCQHLPAASGYWVIPTKRPGSEHVTDFLIGEDTPHQPTWHAVELERPQALLFTKAGDPSRALTHAMRQIDDWRSWISRNRDYASRAPAWSGLGLGDIDPELEGLVILGRAAVLNASVEDRRRRLARANRMRIETYDWLITQAEDRANPPNRDSLLLDFLLRKEKFHDMRARRAIETIFRGVATAYASVSAVREIECDLLILDDDPNSDSETHVHTSDYEVIYSEVCDYRRDSTARLSLADWSDWLNSPAMAFIQRFTLLVTEIEPDEALQALLFPMIEGLWTDEARLNERVQIAQFLLHLPLNLPLSEKEARCRALKECMTSLTFRE